MSKEDEAAARMAEWLDEHAKDAIDALVSVCPSDLRLLLAERERLREALRPFANLADILNADLMDQGNYCGAGIFNRDLVAARAALKGD